MITVYGISNCDTVKKARRWLEQHAIEYRFHDVRSDGLTPEQVRAWLQELGWETLINRRSTSWKALAPAAREQMNDTLALTAILEQPTLIKRPLLDIGHERHCGFSAPAWEALLLRHTL
ncbi:MAG: ArsC family reductase [Halieaceae bacterium]|jgi:Spx/MgsR family transcriptional regulator|uniref:ArsC family reductase n=1 Tax=Haliea alexandrii TaxID=2448162 RepID=UPI000F0B8123|nr:ArsC family reductase [Haliea alexandrii]MCR9186469.1 ArsC family reductase [Halieaceae bacterium]